MTPRDDEQVFLDHAKRVLEARAESLDELTRARLRAARKQALAAAAPVRTPWKGRAFGGAFATAAVVVLAVVLWSGPEQGLDPVVPAAELDDMELLLSGEELEVFEDADFYLWLADVHETG
ncbi:MAG TPA: hypothetical protein ENJ19_03950 [Gammaproteobacteria bacterium]|nr:hypothetical protein [Gammaproteobacteria bacterium]